jgi:hypothetical protein
MKLTHDQGLFLSFCFVVPRFFKTRSRLGMSMEEFIVPGYCAKKEYTSMLRALGVRVQDLQLDQSTDSCAVWFRKQSKPMSIDEPPKEANVENTIQKLTRLLMQFTMLPPRPDSAANAKEARECGYLLPYQTVLSYFRMILLAQQIYPKCTTFLMDLCLIPDQALAQRPFVKHRSISFRAYSSVLRPLIGEALSSDELLLPK